jgi:hypothetical protein
MQPKLKEDPKEWQKFTLVMALALMLIFYLFYRRKWVSVELTFWVFLILSAAIITCAFFPPWFRGFYRAGMTASFHVGQFMGRILLIVVFWLVLTPLGLWLRLMGKDLLQTKRNPAAKSYWHPAKTGQKFDRLF